MKTKQIQTLGTLTAENCATVSTVINKKNPEWGVKRFSHNGQALFGGEYLATCDQSVLFTDEFRFWDIVSFN